MGKVIVMENPTLETERLLLRHMTEKDIPFVYRLFSRSETNKYSEYPDLQNMKEAEDIPEARRRAPVQVTYNSQGVQ